MKRKICLAIFTLCLLVVLTMFCSCELVLDTGIVNAQINENGELVLIYENGRVQNLGTVVGKDGEDGRDAEGTQNGVTSDTSSVSGASLASTKGLMSSVSIICNYKTTVQQGGWRPGSSGTTTKEYSSAGSGVIYKMDKSSGDAFIITNYHVVYDASSDTENGISDDISVYLYGSEIEEKAIKATYVGGSQYYDIAVIRVEDSEVLMDSSAAQVECADSDTVCVGESAIAIGNAKGYGISACFGIVSVDSEYITMTAADGKTEVSFRVMRVDTAVNSGNSGGGLFDNNGNLIGIVNAKVVDESVENIGYVIPSNVAVSVAQNIIDYCYQTNVESVQRAVLGITVSITDSKAVYDSETGKINIEEVVSVYEVANGSVAEGILQAGDIIVQAEVNGNIKEIKRQYQVIDMMLDVRVGDTVRFDIVREGEAVSVSVEITEGCLTAY